MTASTPAAPTSPWTSVPGWSDIPTQDVPPGPVDVAVVGAGVTGLSTALSLARAGRDVTLLEAHRLGDNTSTHSTVKVSVGQGLMLSRIARARGMSAARTYAHVNAGGLAAIRRLVTDLSIDCDLSSAPHDLYARTPRDAGRLRREYDLAASFGLPVSQLADPGLPFTVTAAIRFDDQVLLHPGRYLLGLARGCSELGVRIVTRVRVIGVDEGDRVLLRTTAGPLAARDVVLATHVPALDRGGHFARLEPQRSYAVAVALPYGAAPAPCTFHVGMPSRSTRGAVLDGRSTLVVAGEGHSVGRVVATEERWDRLVTWAARHFGGGDVLYRWSAQDPSSLDHVPYVGRLTPGTRHLWTATGYGKWGFTNGTAAAEILTALITGRRPGWRDTFDARRIGLPGALPRAAALNARVGATWLRDRIGRPPVRHPQQLAPGEASALRVDGSDVAAYRDLDGRLHAVSAVCTHLGCSVRWNSGESSWDCPCHGSRFGIDGEVLEGPAVRPLRRAPLSDA